MDLQFHVLANDPTFFGLYGVTSYLSAYSDEETIRWVGKLYRHYCIEGKTDRLTDTYRLPHLQNPDFEDGLNSWAASPAAEGSITTGSLPGLSWLEGRYPMTTQGNSYLLMKRSDKAPNRVTQTLKALQPGKLYSLKMISSDYGELTAGKSSQQTYALSLDLSDVELAPDKCFQFPFPSCYAHSHGPFNRDNRAWFNLHNLVFRAQGTEAKLTISDWAKTDQAGGPAGQELLMNFVEVQPYYAD